MFNENKFKTKLNVCQFYIGVCCFNRNSIFMYRLSLLFFFCKKKGGGRNTYRSEQIANNDVSVAEKQE